MDEREATIRVSDDDRTQTMRRLADGFAQGRLDSQMFEDRNDRALVAVSHTELTALTADLPSDPQSAARRDRAEWLLEARWWVAGAVLMNGVWLVQHLLSDDGVRYWPALPLAIWGLILVGAMIVPRSTTGDPTQGPVRPAER